MHRRSFLQAGVAGVAIGPIFGKLLEQLDRTRAEELVQVLDDPRLGKPMLNWIQEHQANVLWVVGDEIGPRIDPYGIYVRHEQPGVMLVYCNYSRKQMYSFLAVDWREIQFNGGGLVAPLWRVRAANCRQDFADLIREHWPRPFRRPRYQGQKIDFLPNLEEIHGRS